MTVTSGNGSAKDSIVTMEYRRLGKTGLKVSALSYGSWVTFSTQAQLPQVKEMMKAAFDAGINFFDTAEVYANGQAEVLMGQAIKELGFKRSDLVLSTKIFWGGPGPNDKGLSRKHIIEGTKASLKRMDQEYVDLLFCHRPDPDTPIEETVRAMSWCVDHGLALYWGTSEWSHDQIAEAHKIAERLNLVPPHFEQPEYNMFARNKVEKEFGPLYDTTPGLGTTIWSPLASGILTGKYSGGKVPEGSRLQLDQHKDKLERRKADIEKADQLLPIAQELGCSLAQLSLAWCLKNPRVSTVILGASRVEQLHENIGAMAVLPKITDDVMSRIEGIIKTKPT